LGHAPFFLGAADAPIDPPPGWRPDKLAAKIAAGAAFAQTQFCMDSGIVRRYAARLAEHEATRGCFLLVGIAPLRSAKSARWMKENLFGTIIPDASSSDWKSRRSRGRGPAHRDRADRGTGDHPGRRRVHIMAPANEAAVPDVIAEARKRLPQRKAK